MLLTKTLDELNQKSLRDLTTFSNALVEKRHDTRGLKCCELQQFVGKSVGFVALCARASNGYSETTQVFYERKTKSDSDRPEFTDRERRNRLIRCDKPFQGV